MKKTVGIFSAISILILTLLVLAFNFSVSIAEKPIGQTATVTNVFGEIAVQRAGGSEWTAAIEDMTLKAGDSIISGDSSSATLNYFDGSKTLIFPKTALRISEMSGNPDGSGKMIRSNQWMGQTLNRVERLLDVESRYEIETPNAVTAVRGTQYWVIVNEDGTTQVDVLEGIVDVTAQEYLSGSERIRPPRYSLEVNRHLFL